MIGEKGCGKNHSVIINSFLRSAFPEEGNWLLKNPVGLNDY